MHDSNVTSAVNDGVLTLTLNRPEVLNALNAPLLAELQAALITAAADPDVGALVLCGAGRGFCAGGDLRSGATERSTKGKSGEDQQLDEFDAWSASLREAMEISRLIHCFPAPTIARLHGPTAGAGLSLAAACDIRVAGASASFTTAFIKVGFSGDFGITYFLTRLLGTAKACELMFLSDKIDAMEAQRIGLVQRVVADDALEASTRELAKRVASGPRVAYRYMKRNLNAAEEGSLEHMLDMEALHLTRTRYTKDHREAARAFAEKRPPVFTGK
jgi:2-(1,2-epoxy-1,2-dihydrophenyl)acetyl-CoA isomerase